MTDRAQVAGLPRDGYSIVKRAERVRRPIPEFAKDEETLRRVLLAPYLVQYRICELIWLRGWSSADVAEALDLKPGTVRQILRRTRRKFEPLQNVTPCGEG